eukprot:CAMPEP_0184186368 /NCGR_PEP_ID=MMETSP0976-20121227/387_1 /TAXON_ID=483370 /ORGANISM="non described non described, Strain CCMP2097" /LENGTH=1136 /DNA_ID=CAMNT_0026490657 /DNA_START=46 /DNA_END=3454 /DNA_ORIENTATION=-
MAANRGEIAIRIFRAASEKRFVASGRPARRLRPSASVPLDIRTVAIYSKEDMKSMHRYKADEAYMVGKDKSPVGAYLGYEEIVDVALRNDVDAIHPGYGFLSENAHFARLCEDRGIAFVGPKSDVLNKFGDKTLARELAIRHGVPVVPGTPGECNTLTEVRAFVEDGANAVGYPVIIKAAHGGGGRGMRVVRNAAELGENLERAQSEALAAFGNAAVFVERYVDSPRHVEVQILADGDSTLHLYERDCSVQRRFQKVVEVAPSTGLPDELKAALLGDAVRLTAAAGYSCAGTVEFLVDPKTWKHYFIEVNPRIQVEHTVTEVVTAVDIVQAQIRIAQGESLADIGLPSQAAVALRGYAIQSRVTTEDPENRFRPDTGRLQTWRPAEGFGIRLDGGNAFTGAVISPHYDSLLTKVTGSALTYEGAIAKVRRALRETRIRGVKTNIGFTLNVLAHPVFVAGAATTSFIADYERELFTFRRAGDRASKLLEYLGDLVVNGRKAVGATGPATPRYAAVLPPVPAEPPAKALNLKRVLEAEGPAGFARAVRAHPGLLLTDTTMRDAHQSLMATRVRTRDLVAAAPYTSHALANAYSLENWGGATFDVALRFLHECPWDRLGQLREAVPNVPFQMLLRGANGVGYTSYPDNAVFKFCDVAVKHGMDVFRVFDSLNYVDNLYLGIDAVGAAGGVVEAAISYTGDVSPAVGDGAKYNLEYYLKLARQLETKGIHILCIKDMAGLLKPAAATRLVSALRAEHPHLPIHVHTHDTAGTGVVSMLAAGEAGADAVDCAIDSMAGLTSQPSMGAIVASLQGTRLDTGVDLAGLGPLIDYWESARVSYAAFESGQKSGSSEVYAHEMPGGQYTNLLFQATTMGLSEKWPQVKRAYAAANALLGDIIKVTPSSKTVGDLAQFMVTNGLSADDVRAQASTLSFPGSVVEFFQGALGIPHGGFPEPLRTDVLSGAGKLGETFEGRPGVELEPVDFAAVRVALEEKHGITIDDADLMSAVMYPKVFDDFCAHVDRFGCVQHLPTRAFVEPLEVNEELEVELERGKSLHLKLLGVGHHDAKSGTRECFFELNGFPRSVKIPDTTAAAAAVQRRPRAVAGAVGSVGAPMPGVVVEVRARVGDRVAAGGALAVLSA